MVGLGIGQLFIGPLSDHYGRRRLLLGGMTLLTIASLAGAISANIQLLIVTRFFQGLGGAAGIVLFRAIISDLCPGTKAARYFNLVLAIQDRPCYCTTTWRSGCMVYLAGSFCFYGRNIISLHLAQQSFY
jgi:MFS family permease